MGGCCVCLCVCVCASVPTLFLCFMFYVCCLCSDITSNSKMESKALSVKTSFGKSTKTAVGETSKTAIAIDDNFSFDTEKIVPGSSSKASGISGETRTKAKTGMFFSQLTHMYGRNDYDDKHCFLGSYTCIWNDSHNFDFTFYLL